MGELIGYCGTDEHLQVRDKGSGALWVVQKYMENPLIVAKRKFDIRQWVLVTDWNPLTIYFYNTCYVRFSAAEYTDDEKSLENSFVHLVNNSISKNSNDFHAKVIAENGVEVEDCMWSLDTFRAYLKDTTGEDKFAKHCAARMREIAREPLICAQGQVEHRKNSWELYGYDYMIDDQYRPWLIEINSSPACDYSTSVTEEFVPQALTDVVKVVVDLRDWEKSGCQGERPDTGGWENIYKGQFLETPVASFGLDLACKGQHLDTKKALARRRAAHAAAAAAQARAAAAASGPAAALAGLAEKSSPLQSTGTSRAKMGRRAKKVHREKQRRTAVRDDDDDDDSGGDEDDDEDEESQDGDEENDDNNCDEISGEGAAASEPDAGATPVSSSSTATPRVPSQPLANGKMRARSPRPVRSHVAPTAIPSTAAPPGAASAGPTLASSPPATTDVDGGRLGLVVGGTAVRRQPGPSAMPNAAPRKKVSPKDTVEGLPTPGVGDGQKQRRRKPKLETEATHTAPTQLTASSIDWDDI